MPSDSDPRSDSDLREHRDAWTQFDVSPDDGRRMKKNRRATTCKLGSFRHCTARDGITQGCDERRRPVVPKPVDSSEVNSSQSSQSVTGWGAVIEDTKQLEGMAGLPCGDSSGQCLTTVPTGTDHHQPLNFHGRIMPPWRREWPHDAHHV